jgi:hypothetical protein
VLPAPGSRGQGPYHPTRARGPCGAPTGPALPETAGTRSPLLGPWPSRRKLRPSTLPPSWRTLPALGPVPCRALRLDGSRRDERDGCRQPGPARSSYGERCGGCRLPRPAE